MRILVLGADGYLGWPTTVHLARAGHRIAVLDNGVRRLIDKQLGTRSLVPIATLRTRVRRWHSFFDQEIDLCEGDLTEPGVAAGVLRWFRPDAVVHFAEQRSAPYSMIDRQHAVFTQVNNVVGTLNLLYAIAEVDPGIHLVKLGSMGEYGTPNVTIEEGWLDVEHDGRTDRMLYPKRPGSFYHLSKVHDSHNIEFACRTWGLRATDLNQGVVYGQQTPETAADALLATRFDYDAIYGTVLNRFVVQAALGHPITVYGGGMQTRGIIELRDSVECIRIACENPADPGEFRVFNQMTQALSVNQIAQTVAACCDRDVPVQHCENPRVEAEEHYFRARHSRLEELGLRPHLLSDTLLESMFEVTRRHLHRVLPERISPTIRWQRPGSAPGADGYRSAEPASTRTAAPAPVPTGSPVPAPAPVPVPVMVSRDTPTGDLHAPAADR